MERTLDRKTFLALMAQWGHADAPELVEAVLADLGWADRQAFTKADVIAVAEAVTAAGVEMAKDAPGATPEEQAHLQALLGTVQAHALPLLKRDAKG